MVDVGCLATVYLNRLGKEGCSTLSYEVTVDHCKRIIACREGHKGTRNDETIECLPKKNCKLDYLIYFHSSGTFLYGWFLSQNFGE